MESVKRGYNHISMEERRQIYRLAGQKISVTEIAAPLRRHRSTIFREIQRNTHRHEEEAVRGYFPVTAQDFASERRRKQRKLIHSKKLRNYIIEKLQAYWSPDQISGYLRRQESGFYVCPETIYSIFTAPKAENKACIVIFSKESPSAARASAASRAESIFLWRIESISALPSSMKGKYLDTGNAT